MTDQTLKEGIPKTITVLNAFTDTNNKPKAICTAKAAEILLASLFATAGVNSTSKIDAAHPWGGQNPILRMLSLVKLEDLKILDLTPLAIMVETMHAG